MMIQIDPHKTINLGNISCLKCPLWVIHSRKYGSCKIEHQKGTIFVKTERPHRPCNIFLMILNKLALPPEITALLSV